MDKKRKISQLAASVTLVAAVVLCIVVIAQTLSVGYVTILGRSLFRVATGSMEPTIPTGSLLICKEEVIENINEGDIICFRSKESNMLGQVITHRVTRIMRNEDGERYLETAGDANPSADGFYVTESNLIGKVSFYTKEGNWFAAIFSFITSRMGFLACIVFPVLIISTLIMRDSIKTIRKELEMLTQQSSYSEGEAEVSSVDSSEKLFTADEYNEMVSRLKKEILEEVKQIEKRTENESITENE